MQRSRAISHAAIWSVQRGRHIAPGFGQGIKRHDVTSDCGKRIAVGFTSLRDSAMDHAVQREWLRGVIDYIDCKLEGARSRLLLIDRQQVIPHHG